MYTLGFVLTQPWPIALLQGCLMSGLLAAPLRLASITVALPPHDGSDAADGACSASHAAAAAEALRRAVVGRTAELAGRVAPPFAGPQPPVLCTVSPSAEALAGLGLRPGGPRRVPCGSALIWSAPPSTAFKAKPGPVLPGPPGAGPPPAVLREGTADVVAGHVGVRLGRSHRPGTPVPPGARPGVSRAALLDAFLDAAGAAGGAGGASHAALHGLTYRATKEAAGAEYRAAWAALLAPPSPLEAWLPKPPHLEGFRSEQHRAGHRLQG